MRNTKDLRRIFLRSHRRGLSDQIIEKEQNGSVRNFRSPEGRQALIRNSIYRKNYWRQAAH